MTVSARIFLSYRSQPPDLGLAQELFRALLAAGHRPFLAGESIRLGERWPARIDEELERCDFFLLLLSPRSVASEMVAEEVRKARALRESRRGERPVILPIRVDLPLGTPLPYELGGYLGAIQQREWHPGEDTGRVIDEVLAILAGAETPWPAAPSAGPCLSGPPPPAAAPELPEGQVDLASAFYVERPPVEASCYQMIERPGALIRIKAPRQMGKTSLMARVLHHAAAHGHRTVPLTFQLADGTVFASLDELLRWFCSSVSWALELPDRVDELWNRTGAKMRATSYFERYLLREVGGGLTLGLDEVDLVFQYPEVADDFLGMLRAWHEQAKSSPVWRSLRLVIVHSTEVYIPLHINQSPFNVGLPVELPELNAEQVADLAARHGLAWSAGEVATLMSLVGGHPFLVRIALYYAALGEVTLEQLRGTEAALETGLYGDHLRRHLWNLEGNPELAEAFRQVVTSGPPVRLDSELAFKLDSLGLVTLHGNQARPRFDLYRTYFRERLRA